MTTNPARREFLRATAAGAVLPATASAADPPPAKLTLHVVPTPV
jgi:hypothetical protein